MVLLSHVYLPVRYGSPVNCSHYLMCIFFLVCIPHPFIPWHLATNHYRASVGKVHYFELAGDSVLRLTMTQGLYLKIILICFRLCRGCSLS